MSDVGASGSATGSTSAPATGRSPRGVGPRGLWSDAWIRLRGNRVVLVAMGLIVLIAVVAVCGPALSPYADDTLDWQHLAVAPGFEASHWLGTDRLGRDLFVRTLHEIGRAHV